MFHSISCESCMMISGSFFITSISYQTNHISMSYIDGMLEYNKEFVRNRLYEEHQTSKYPDKRWPS